MVELALTITNSTNHNINSNPSRTNGHNTTDNPINDIDDNNTSGFSEGEPTSEESENNNNNNNSEGDDPEFFNKMRGWLMIVAILAAGSTYQAGLSPPGGFWQETKEGMHIAGDSVLHDEYFRRYQAFFYCNAISFLSSLVIIILLMKKNFFRDSKKLKVLKITMVLDLFSFMTAYAAGSSRRVMSSLYVILMMAAIFGYVFLMFLMAALDVNALARNIPCPCVPMEQNRPPPREPTRSPSVEPARPEV